jgi:hypothetical protein
MLPLTLLRRIEKYIVSNRGVKLVIIEKKVAGNLDILVNEELRLSTDF